MIGFLFNDNINEVSGSSGLDHHHLQMHQELLLQLIKLSLMFYSALKIKIP